jgi:hypothetical protein
MRLLPMLLFAFVLILTASCKKEKGIEEVAEIGVKRMHTVFVEKEIPIENLFELKEIIPVKIDEQNFLVDVYRLQVSDFGFFLLDKEFGTLIKTSKDGLQHLKIGEFGSGPEEFPDIADFSLSKIGSELLLISIEERSLAFFDLDGNFKKKIRLKNQSDMLSVDKTRNIGMSITYFNDDFSNFQLLDSTGQKITTMFPFPKDLFPILLKNVSGHVTNNFDGDILYHEPANSIIFEIKGNDFFPKYQFESDEPMWPKEKKHELNNFFETLASGKLSFLTRFFEESETHLYFGWNKKKETNSPSVVDFRIGVFDKKTNETYLTKESKITSLMSGPMAVVGEDVYFVLSMYDLKELSSEVLFKEFGTKISQFEEDFKDKDFPVILKMSLIN